MQSLQAIKAQMNSLRAEFALARAGARTEMKALEDVEARISAAEEGQELVQTVAQGIQQRIHKQIASVVSRCLAAVLDDPYTFHIEFERKRGRTEARLAFMRDGFDVDPMTASGGGVKDIAALALRLSCLMLSRPPVRPLLVLDEPFKFVSRGFRDRLCVLLETLSKEMGVQFLIVTNIEELEIGRVIKI